MTTTRPLEGKRILILEDDFYLARDAKVLLEQAGADVVGPFGTAFRIEELQGTGDLDGAAVDINLGHGPSFGFARLLRDQGVPFVFVTGYDAAVIPSELAHVERVEKPIREKEFIAAMARLGESDGIRSTIRIPGS